MQLAKCIDENNRDAERKNNYVNSSWLRNSLTLFILI